MKVGLANGGFADVTKKTQVGYTCRIHNENGGEMDGPHFYGKLGTMFSHLIDLGLTIESEKSVRELQADLQRIERNILEAVAALESEKQEAAFLNSTGGVDYEPA